MAKDFTACFIFSVFSATLQQKNLFDYLVFERKANNSLILNIYCDYFQNEDWENNSKFPSTLKLGTNYRGF